MKKYSLMILSFTSAILLGVLLAFTINSSTAEAISPPCPKMECGPHNLCYNGSEEATECRFDPVSGQCTTVFC